MDTPPDRIDTVAAYARRCPFCDIAIGVGRARFVEPRPRAGTVMAFEPLNPVTPGHVLFVPRQHVRHAAEDPPLAGVVAAAAAEWAELQGQPFNLITSGGTWATQTVMHLHWHYLPRAEGDGLALPWTGQAEREGRAEPEPPRSTSLPGGPGLNQGHGHVYPRPDGARTRCGGPRICPACAADLARQQGDS